MLKRPGRARTARRRDGAPRPAALPRLPDVVGLLVGFGRIAASEAEVPNMSVRLAWSGWTAVRGDSAAEPHLGLERAPVARPRPHALVLEHPAGREAEERRR